MTRSLALPQRGGVPNDVLQLQSLSMNLQLTWTARPVHPWDRDLAPLERNEAFARQCLQDVDAAIARLFARFEMVDTLDIAVVHPASHATVLTGVVSRADFAGAKRLSILMRLKTAGLKIEASVENRTFVSHDDPRSPESRRPEKALKGS